MRKLILIILLILVIGLLAGLTWKAEKKVTKLTTNKSVNTSLNSFCGFSTHGVCSTDEDCIRGGCSGQVCQAKGERVVTTCEWKECYDWRKYNVSCKCINNTCQWV